jgi:hypothetical protein
MATPVLTLLEELAGRRFAQVELATTDEVLACASFGDLWSAAKRMPGSVAVVDWQRIGGLLSEEHRHDLSVVERIVPIILLFDAKHGQHMSAEDLGVTAVLDCPMQDRALLHALAIGRSKRSSQPMLARP